MVDRLNMKQAQAKTRIIGIGSPHGADQVGWIAAQRLIKLGVRNASVDLLRTPLELLDHLEGCQKLIILDACRSDDPNGTVQRLEWPDSRIIDEQSHSSHGWSVGQALLLAQKLGRLPESVILFGLVVDFKGETTDCEEDFYGTSSLEASVLTEIGG